MDIGGKDVKNKDAENKYLELKKEYVRKCVDRDKELKLFGITSTGLDGYNYYKDIDDWFRDEVIALQIKYYGQTNFKTIKH